MTRLFTRRPAAVMVFMAGIVCPAVVLAQFAPTFTPKSQTVQIASIPRAELRGTVVDEQGQPLGGVVPLIEPVPTGKQDWSWVHCGGVRFRSSEREAPGRRAMNLRPACNVQVELLSLSEAPRIIGSISGQVLLRPFRSGRERQVKVQSI